MKISMHNMSVDVFVTTLTQLSAILEKGLAHAKARNFDPAVLFGARLFPDMLPFSRQVQIACDIAKNSAARLAGQEPPRFEDTETTFEELQARIARTIDYLKGLPAAAFEGSEERQIQIQVPGRTFEFTGLSLLQRWALPNLYFHTTIAYALLRHNGVELGKADFLGPL